MRLPALSRRATRALAAVAAVSFVAACGRGHKSPTAPTDITGTYALVSIDGQALPAAIAANSQNVTQAKSGYLTLNGDLTFGIGFVVTASGHDSTITALGTYTRTGTDLAFSSTVDGLSGTLPGTVPSANVVNLTTYFSGGTHATVFRK